MENKFIEEEIRKGSIVIDVRTKGEYDKSHINGAVNVKYDNILSGVKKYVADKNKKIIVYCSNGNRSKIAKTLLNNFGYNNVIDIGKINL